MPARKTPCVYPLDVTKPGVVVLTISESRTPEERRRRGEGLVRLFRPLVVKRTA